jgi:bifunctional NMN adenylyltransferase/nudix hydrolase
MLSRTAVLTGRFAPFCNAHLGVIWQALKDNDEVVIIVTDADFALSSRLPWTADERVAMARAACADFGDKVRFVQTDAPPRHILDMTKVESLAGISFGVIKPISGAEEAALASLYAGDDEALRATVPTAIFDEISALRQSKWFADFAQEHRYFEDYKAAWKAAPYPVVLVSVDAVIVQSGHLLLVERGRIPGKGLWALPGGFVEPDEWLEDAALRELCEETSLDLNPENIGRYLKGSHVFDDPWRSGRGRVITHAYHFELEGKDLPFIYGQDDAAAARWVPLAEIKAMRGRFFDDHGRIISHFLEV